jgi:hypothetical protein
MSTDRPSVPFRGSWSGGCRAPTTELEPFGVVFDGPQQPIEVEQLRYLTACAIRWSSHKLRLTESSFQPLSFNAAAYSLADGGP